MELLENLIGKVAFPLWNGVLKGRPTSSHLRFVEETQWRSRHEIDAIQAGELRRLLDHAYANVPYYRRLFDEAGLKPTDIRSAADLSRLPIIDRAEAIRSVSERTAVAGARVDIQKATSGTTGMPLTIGYDWGSDYWRQAMRMRGYGWAGYRIGRRALHLWGFDNPLATPFRKAKLDAHRWLQREVFFDCVRRGEAELEAFARAIETYRPRLIVSYSHAAADFARYVLAKDRRTWDDIPIICGAERLLPEDRPLVEEVFGRGIFETYGCREVMLIAAECDAHQEMHVSMENLVAEIVVRENGRERPARPGEVGEVVITDLHNLAMPFIRYANGDLATAGSDQRCPCGRGLQRLMKVDGRMADTMVDAKGNRLAGLMFNMLLSSLKDIITQFQVVQHADKSVTIKIVPGPRYAEEGRAAVYGVITKYLRGLEVRVNEVALIPLDPSGKRRIVQVEKAPVVIPELGHAPRDTPREPIALRA
jgi:phenylacetate-CoA ligase